MKLYKNTGSRALTDGSSKQYYRPATLQDLRLAAREFECVVVPESKPHLVNHGDGVDGHYCVRKLVNGTAYHWDANVRGWRAFGTLLTFKSKEEAAAEAAE